MNEYEKNCPQCGDDFEATHLNQNYCSSKCRIRANNGKARRERNRQKKFTKEVDEILISNRDILAGCRGQVYKLQTLKRKGFRTNYITYFEDVEGSHTVFYCYDMKYRFKDEDSLEIL